MQAIVGSYNDRQAPIPRLIIGVIGILLVLAPADAAATTPSPSPHAAAGYINTTAPPVNATINVVSPPDTVLNTSMLSNVSLSYLGFAHGASLFNASLPMEAENSTVSPLPTTNTSVASLIPSNATQNVSQNSSNTLLIPDPSWGAAILVNSSALRTTQLVVSNTTQTESTTVFTTVYNTTTVRELFILLKRFSGHFGSA